MHDNPQTNEFEPYDHPTMASGPSKSLARGTKLLNRYVIEKELGRGGFGAVYLCQDEVAGIQVAVKTIPPELAHDSMEMSKIRDNFQLVEKLHHPNIAAIKTLEKDPDADSYYVVMEYVPGEDLVSVLRSKKGGLEPEKFMRIGREMASALDYGHDKGILHRDIKPANVRVTPHGETKILDYGIADQIQESLSRVTSGTHQISGTGPYMSPEQWKGKSETASADQYALAITLYECIVGRPPFNSKDSSVLREMIINEEPEKPKQLNDAQWAVMQKALDKDATQRYDSCIAFVEALEEAFGMRKASSHAGHGKTVLAVAAAAVLAVGAFIILSGNKDQAPVEMTQSQTPAAAAPAEGIPEYHAIVIGISDYAEHVEGWNDLSTPRADAEAVADALENRFGFQVKRLIDEKATRGNITAALDGLSELSEDDACLVYFAGHGYYDESINEGYWIPADARSKIEGRPAKEDWVWNSFITKMLDASRARHILLLADSCYSGSLFRGNDLADGGRQLNWYRRALDTPSRFLITSGDLEPVMDGGGRHSVFASQVLNFLNHSAKDVFSASDLGQAVREKVSAMTGQLVRSGQLAVSAHAGGEFVFVKNPNALSLVEAAPSTGSEVPASTITRSPNDVLEDSIALHNAGAEKSAQQLLAKISGDYSALAQKVAGFLDQKARTEKTDALRKLIDKIETREVNTEAPAADRPTIIGILGPAARGGGEDSETQALLMRLSISSLLEGRENTVVVEREAIQDILTEMDLSTSKMSDKQMQLQIGKLMPASRLVLGDLFKMGEKTTVMMRLVDTETTRVIKSAQETLGADSNPMEVAQGLLDAMFAADQAP